MTDWGISDIKAPASWQFGFTGKGVKIAVIDTGSGPHSDLKIAGGINVINGSATTEYADDNGHGTHTAGIIGAQGVNGGVKGVAPDASVFAVKALDSTGSGYTSDIISGIDWAIDNGMDIISLSLGASKSSLALQNAVDMAYSKGLLVVAAAGNSGNAEGTGNNVEYPANYDSVIAVSAVDAVNMRAYFSSTGSKVEVSAPGVNIVSTYLNGRYAQMSGTSMAAPFVAGDLALLKQEYPSYTNVQLRQLLDNSVVDLGVQGRDPLYGFGLIVAPSNANLAAPPTSDVSPLPVATQPAAPTASVAAGIYTSSQNVSLGDTTPGVSIYYTLDGTIPTSKSNLYASPITINSTRTLKAVAIDNTGISSKVLSVTYVISQPKSTIIPAPIASVPSGLYKTHIFVKLYDRYSGPLRAYYTLDGSTPTINSRPYTGYINITATSTLKAIAVDRYGNVSEISNNSYTIIKLITNPVVRERGEKFSTKRK